MAKLTKYQNPSSVLGHGKIIRDLAGKVRAHADPEGTDTSTHTESFFDNCTCCPDQCPACDVMIPFYAPVITNWESCYDECILFGTSPGEGSAKIIGGTINGQYCLAFVGNNGTFCEWLQIVRPCPINIRKYSPVGECEEEVAHSVAAHVTLRLFGPHFVFFLLIEFSDGSFGAVGVSAIVLARRCSEGPQDVQLSPIASHGILDINIPPGDGTCDGFEIGDEIHGTCEPPATETDTGTGTDTGTDTQTDSPQPCPADCSGCAHVPGLYLDNTEGGTLDGFLPDLLRVGDTCVWQGSDATYTDVEIICVQDGADYFWQITIEAGGDTFVFRSPVLSGCPSCHGPWTQFSTTQSIANLLNCGGPSTDVTCCQSGDCCFDASCFAVMTVTKTTSGATSCFGPACCRPDVTHSAIVLDFLNCDGGVAYFQNADDPRYFAQFDGTTWGYGGFGEPLYGYPPREDCSDPGDEALCADYAEPLPSVSVSKDDCAGYVATATGTINFGVCGTVTQVESVSILISSNDCCRDLSGNCVQGNGGGDGACP